MNWETYAAFGDSITIGARSYLGYPELTGSLLRQHLHKQWNIVNHAVSGYKAIDLARYIDASYTQLQAHRPSISSILIGTNDAKVSTSVDNFEVALDLVITKVRILTQNNNVVLFHIPELTEGIMYPYRIDMNELIGVFNQSIDRLASRHNLRTLTLSFDKGHFYDGVHLNQSGVEAAASQVAGMILRERGIQPVSANGASHG